MPQREKSGGEPVVIKKYPNRRLYNTGTSTYVTQDDLCEMVKKEEDFVVYDAKTNEDLTRQVLSQIIFEQESRGRLSLLPANFLRSVIRLYDGNMAEMVPHYLEASMDHFTRNQERIREYMGRAMGEFSPFSQLEEISKQNMDLLQKTMNMFNPFDAMFGKAEEKKGSGGKRS